MNWIKTRWVTHLLANPLLVKEIRRPTTVNARKILKVCFVVGVVVVIFSIIFSLIAHESSFIPLVGMVFGMIYFFLVISAAPFVAYTAVILTVNTMRSESFAFDLLQLTSLSDAHLIKGYILSTLYRCRVFFALLMGAAPFGIIWGTYFSVYSGYIRCLEYVFGSRTCELPSPALIPLAFMSFVVLVISMIGIWILAASMGVFFAALSKSRLMPSIPAVLFSLFASCVALIVLMNGNVLNTFLASLFYLPFPYLFALSVIKASYPLARKKI